MAADELKLILDSYPGILWGTCRWDGRVRPCRGANRLPEKANGLIVVLFPYYSGPRSGGNLSLYARVPDYHRVAGDLLASMCEQLSARFPENSFVPFCDNSPIYEVNAAARAGLGVKGNNGLLINPLYGSYVFVGEIVTDRELPEGGELSPCSMCGKCTNLCPGGALGEKGLDAKKCLSALTQKKGELTPEETALIKKGNLIWGCDTCQTVCLHNRNVRHTKVAAFGQDIIDRVEEDNAEALCQDRAFGFRGPGVLLRNLRIMKEK